jgi:anti-sigma-K factor RskA
MHPELSALNGYVDDALGAAERADIERHVESCGDCRAAIRELREIRQVATSLDPRDPPARSWSRLQRAIALEHGFKRTDPEPPAVPVGRRPIWVGLAAAAALVVAAGIGLQTPYFKRSSPPTPETAANNDAAAQAVEAELRQAEQHYEKAIQGLETIASTEKGALDPQTAATMQKNLAVIDQAIGESRAALRAQPTSAPAQQSLLESFKAKLALLEDTVALINEMRKGNEAGAARIVSDLKGKG